MEIQKLNKNQRYTFHIKDGGSLSIKIIRANIKKIMNHKHITVTPCNEIFEEDKTTIILYSSDSEISKNTEVSIPYEWIVKVENLEYILQDIPILNRDILRLIDNYI